MDDVNTLYDSDYCYECSGYGDDYYIDEQGEMVCRCDDCIFSQYYERE